MKTENGKMANCQFNESYRHDPLWQRLEAFTPDDPDASFPFTKKLARENGWNTAFALAAVEEYKRFAYLCCTLPHGASPSPVVDKVWHLHLCYTVNYWEMFCGKILQTKLHHHPSKGGNAEIQKHHQWLQDTLEHYHKIFKTDPPSDIWAQSPYPSFNQRPATISSKRSWMKCFAAFAALLVCVLLTGCEAGPGAGILVFVIGMCLVAGYAGKKKGTGNTKSLSGSGFEMSNDDSNGCSSEDSNGGT